MRGLIKTEHRNVAQRGREREEEPDEALVFPAFGSIVTRVLPVVTRVIDCSTDPHTIFRSIKEICHDFETVGYQIPIFLSVLDELRRKYPYLNDVLPTVF